jgi:hypothetical protein
LGLASAALVALLLAAAMSLDRPKALRRPLAASVGGGFGMLLVALVTPDEPLNGGLFGLAFLLVGPPLLGAFASSGRGRSGYAVAGAAAAAGVALVFAALGVSGDLDSSPQFIFTLWLVSAFAAGLIGVLVGGGLLVLVDRQR